MSDIQALFQKDPLNMTRENDIPEIVNYYRLKRAAFDLGDKTAGATKKMKATVASGEKIKNLDDILSEL